MLCRRDSELSEQTKLDRIVGKSEVLSIAGFSASTLWREIQRKRFPKPIQISPGRVGWAESQIRAWLEARIDAQGQAGHGHGNRNTVR